MAFSFGNTAKFPTQTSAPSFGFGSSLTTAAKPAATGFSFGTPSFGLGTTAATTTTGFGFGGLGSTQNTGFSFGATTTTAAGTGGFGTGSLQFGAGSAVSGTGTAPTFGGFGTTGQQQTGFGSFGAFGAKPATSIGAFGSTGLFSQPQQQQSFLQQQQAPLKGEEAIARAVYFVQIFGDERDQVLAKFNMLQALWGCGKGYYLPGQPPVEFTPANPLCRFKGIAYSRRVDPEEAREGLVLLTFTKAEADVRAGQSQLVQILQTALGDRATIHIDSIRSVGPQRTTVSLYAEEAQQQLGTAKRRCGAAELAAGIRQHLTQLGAESVLPLTLLLSPEVERYLSEPPPGIDARLWKQAQAENPDSANLIPVPVIGFEALAARAKAQEREAAAHLAALDRSAAEVSTLRAALARTAAKVSEQRRRALSLEHRALVVVGRQQIRRKAGQALDPREEALLSRLQALQAHLSAPSVVKARLNESLSQVRLRRGVDGTAGPGSGLRSSAMFGDDLRKFLEMEQDGIDRLVEVVRSDLNSMRTIQEGLCKLLPQQYK
ncbi:probable nucleoporin Nup54 [Schistocerca serialis cubense]|uniref:probable nucleoporin Nup54 n=1 Tax=Schistocerca serialis cubense TaxID=2023355 RepID=UPI00214E5BE9|nr:probable nucleoporin Nup54 [Schistocerca serialis cubense]